MPVVTIRPQARQDIREIFRYYIEVGGIELAKRFRNTASRTFQQLAQFPSMGSPRKVRKPNFRGVRMWRVRGFDSYLVFYFPKEDGIAIERVIHASRDYQRVLR